MGVYFFFGNDPAPPEKRDKELSQEEQISPTYNRVMGGIQSLEEIGECNEVEQVDLARMCQDTIRSKFSRERRFQKQDECNGVYTGSTLEQQQALQICRYNVTLRTIKNREQISECDNIGNPDFARMCQDIIQDRFK